jgi:threonine dehydrogenase-like Zn-dependent dehydrogenase
MLGAVIHDPGDVRYEQREDPQIIAATDAVIRLAAACVCGSDLWGYRGINRSTRPDRSARVCRCRRTDRC